MKYLVVASLLVLACSSSAPPSPQKTGSYRGWVSDASCGAAHVGGKNPSCVRKCIKGGAHVGHPEWTPQAMVLVLDGDQRIVTIANPEALFGKEAEHVTVEGVLEGDTLRVTSVVR